MCTSEGRRATGCRSLGLYDVLGVPIKASAEEIRGAFLRLARVWHPDRHGGAENAKRKFQSIQYAYEVLSNETRRAHYDLQWLDLLDVEDYLNRFKDLILTANGLGMSLSGPALFTEQGAASHAEGDWGPTATSLCGAPIKAA
ncbi:hypothetical protein HYH02_005959 [Chlamydomonas schloesseri]|uniref:J domain-containing protein n=1 Tax=Chlamydomonas schloesseri TaxID=2026947 RepID=A0A836B6N6_9CHLO|nr:hypothetical protein HYH02_005959 [Chlamydomonas schloesseri]|eukprot:KAG2449212.1 hypothetical protein HYH02_005959 [Chlamydomonas schloesseri]